MLLCNSSLSLVALFFRQSKKRSRLFPEEKVRRGAAVEVIWGAIGGPGLYSLRAVVGVSSPLTVGENIMHPVMHVRRGGPNLQD